MRFCLFLYILYGVYHINGYRILVMYPFPIKSLSILGEGIVKHLVNHGHEVTYITAFPLKNNLEKQIRQIDINQPSLDFTSDEFLNITAILAGEYPVNDVSGFQEIAANVADLTFQHENIQKLMHDPNENFDAVIVDLYESELYSGLAVLYDCPMIWSYSMGAHWQVLRLIDEPTNPAYTADYLSSNVPPLNFKQRLEELWAQIKWSFIKGFITLPKERAIYEKTFRILVEKRGRKLPHYDELIFNSSLILSNEYYSFGNIPSTPPNFKFIAGQHIETPAKPLPKDLQTLMDNSKNGVIYFSLGSTWKSKNIPPSITESLLKMFSELKQTVIWKYEADLQNLPNNVHIMKWAPQQSVLAHPNCIIFITHGGLLSSTETIHFGVPIIGVPIMFDQFINTNKAVARGYALKADLTFELADNLRMAIRTMLSNDKYRERVQELSLVYHDRPVSPGAELVHWVEHVVRTRGAPHLRSPALIVPWYQKMYLDLLAAILIVLYILRGVIKRVFRPTRKTNVRKKRN